MVETTKYSKRDGQASFVLKLDDITRIFDAMARFAPHVTCRAECMDGSKPEFTLQSISEYPNSPASAIRSLWFYSFGFGLVWPDEGENKAPEGFDRRASLEFVTSQGKDVMGGVIFRNTIEISVEGPTKYTEPWRKTIEDVLSGTKPWYHRLAFSDPNSMGCLAALAAWFGSVVAYAIWLEQHKSRGSYMLLLIFLSAIAWIWVFGKLSDLLGSTFPRCDIAINKGLEKHEEMNGWRWLFISGVLVAFIVNLVAGTVVSRWL